MNFLQLCQRARSEFGLSGSGPTAVTSQTGEMLRVVNWVNAAWMDIQSAHRDWQWLRTSTSFVTVAEQSTYSPASHIGLTDFGMWERDSFRVYETAAGTNSETLLEYIDYDKWRDSYLFGAMRSATSRPQRVTIAPDKSLGFGPITAAGYTILGDYFKAPSEMSANDDIPALPTHFHMAIVYRAMMHYGAYDAAPEVYQRGELEFKKMMDRMTADRLPEMRFAGALA